MIRTISRLLPRGHVLHKPAIWAFEASGIALLRERWRARCRPKAVFIHIPKTAGTSLHVAFDSPVLNSLQLIRHRFAEKGIVSFGHMSYRELVTMGVVSSRFDRESFKFAFCRNPYDRAVSLFAYLQDIGSFPSGASFLEFCRTLERDGIDRIGPYNTRKLSQCNPQVRWLEGIEMHFVGKFETIADDVRTLAGKLGLSIPAMPRENASRRASFASYYCRESLEIVDALYDEDFRRFGYQRGLDVPGREAPR